MVIFTGKNLSDAPKIEHAIKRSFKNLSISRIAKNDGSPNNLTRFKSSIITTIHLPNLYLQTNAYAHFYYADLN